VGQHLVVVAAQAVTVAPTLHRLLAPFLPPAQPLAEPQQRALDCVFGMRLGEGSGAALAWPLIESACRLLAEMASFDSAGVSKGAAQPA